MAKADFDVLTLGIFVLSVQQHVLVAQLDFFWKYTDVRETTL